MPIRVRPDDDWGVRTTYTHPTTTYTHPAGERSTTSLRDRLIETCHDSPLGGHSMRGKYVATCEHCQRNKHYNSSTRRIPEPDGIPSRRFDVLSEQVEI
jgi:hypothetical protein